MGDGLIYYFPSTVNCSNERAFDEVLECCVTMNSASSAISAKLNEEGLPSMQYRISADYGKVEIARTKTSQDFDFFGPTINLCSRIKNISAPDKILIGGDLFRILKALPTLSNDYNFKPAGEYSVGIKYSYPLYTATSKNNKPIIRTFEQIHELKPVEREIQYSANKILKQRDRTSARVLLVDDERDVLFTFRSILTSQGFLVDTCEEPLEALKHFNDDDRYDLLILDIRCLELTG